MVTNRARSIGLNRIVVAKSLSDDTKLFKVYTPEIARTALPGQFVVLRKDDRGERIPLTIADRDPELGLITLIFQVVGAGTRKLAEMDEWDRLLDVIGPLGVPTHTEKLGTVVCIGGGLGIAPVYPITKGFKEAGNRIVSIIGARTKELLIMEEEMRSASDRMVITTDDGSYGLHGFVTDALKQVQAEERVDQVVAIGPVVMMRAVTRVTAELKLPTIVSLNSIMVDGTGMCGCCRVTVGGKTKFVCVDGPEFDGHKVDFEELMRRQGMYLREENRANWDHKCRLEAQAEVLAAKHRVPMPKQDDKARAKNFNEVALGYTREMAQAEALRCISCKKPKCVKGCPVDIDIPAFIDLVAAGDFLGAIRKIKEKNSLPAVCGRVCPQESQCEELCVLNKSKKHFKEPVAIGRLERFVADYEFEQGEIRAPLLPPPTGKRVAVIGAGPAGLACAGDLALMGHKVTIFEAFHKPGGVLVYGIPEFRLPKRIVQLECDYVEKLGVEFRNSYVVGMLSGVEQLFEDGYDSIFIGTGAGLPYFMNIPGENLNGVYSANEWLTRTNLMKAYLFPEYETPIKVGKRVAVFGGGNVAMDSARCALRLGAEEVYIVYRRSMEEMPARDEEIENAIEEGVIMHILHNPTRFIGDDRGWLKGMELIKMELGEPDASGRRRPVPMEGSEHIVDVDVAVVSIGQGPNPLLVSRTPKLETTRWGNIKADEETGRTNLPGVFAGGDIVTGAATVILAMGAGKKAAKSIDDYLSDGVWVKEVEEAVD